MCHLKCLHCRRTNQCWAEADTGLKWILRWMHSHTHRVWEKYERIFFEKKRERVRMRVNEWKNENLWFTKRPIIPYETERKRLCQCLNHLCSLTVHHNYAYTYWVQSLQLSSHSFIIICFVALSLFVSHSVCMSHCYLLFHRNSP